MVTRSGVGAVERRTKEAFAWAESVTGGRIVSKRRQARWRPHWFLEIDTGASEPLRVMLRGFRNPGYLNDEKGARASLATEAGVIRSLQDSPVRVPRFCGFNDEISWLLMEWVPGTEMLTAIENETLRHDLFRQYMENIAQLHTLDWEKLDVPEGLPRPTTARDNVVGGIEIREKLYRSYQGIDPEPLFELGIRWIHDHAPRMERPVRYCGGDIGPNKFMFEDGRVLARFDLEIAHLGDPLQDLGLMRLREMDYPIGRLPDHLRHWSEVTSLEPDWPECLASRATPRSNAHALLARQLEETFAPRAADDEERFFLECSGALARHLELGNALCPELDRQDLEELGAVLGRRPSDRMEGLAALERAIEADYERDLERRLRVLHRMEVRKEFLWEPIQRATGFASNHPLTRMDGKTHQPTGWRGEGGT